MIYTSTGIFRGQKVVAQATQKVQKDNTCLSSDGSNL
jgi:hypothetical protein